MYVLSHRYRTAVTKVYTVYVQDANSSTEALNSLQGTILHSSQTGEGMRLEYPLVT